MDILIKNKFSWEYSFHNYLFKLIVAKKFVFLFQTILLVIDKWFSPSPWDWIFHTFNYIHGVKSRIKMWVFRWKSCWKRLKKAFECAVAGCSARVLRLVLERAQRSSASNAQATRAIECSFQWLKLYLATLQIF